LNIIPYVAAQSKLQDNQTQQSMTRAINGGLSVASVNSLDTNGWPDTFGQGNTNQTLVRIGAFGTTPASQITWTAANTKIPHNLGFIPTGWRIVYQDKAVSIIAGTPQPDKQFIYLTVSDDTANTTLEIF
jgi:hypothetical protein